jgi:hypothetical protein
MTKTVQADFVRGYGYQGDAERREWRDTMTVDDSFGLSYKNKLGKPGPWSMYLGAWGECLPQASNRISLAKDKRDKWGLPLVNINF